MKIAAETAYAGVDAGRVHGYPRSLAVYSSNACLQAFAPMQLRPTQPNRRITPAMPAKSGPGG